MEMRRKGWRMQECEIISDMSWCLHGWPSNPVSELRGDRISISPPVHMCDVWPRPRVMSVGDTTCTQNISLSTINLSQCLKGSLRTASITWVMEKAGIDEDREYTSETQEDKGVIYERPSVSCTQLRPPDTKSSWHMQRPWPGDRYRTRLLCRISFHRMRTYHMICHQEIFKRLSDDMIVKSCPKRWWECSISILTPT